MNTDVRKNIFCVLMTSEVYLPESYRSDDNILCNYAPPPSPPPQDYVDAFEKLLRLGLKDTQEREIVHVLVDCCLQVRRQ